MGWWSIGTGTDEVIGDESADAVAALLARLSEHRAETAGPKPTLQELLDHLQAALKTNPQFVFNSLGARLSDGRGFESDRDLARDGGIMDILDEGVRTISEIYKEAFERPPTLREMLENFSFVLGYRPERYLSGLEGKEVQEIISKLV